MKTTTGTVSDWSWADVARSSRTALGYLGYGIGERCLPDENDPCGGSFAMHARAYLVAAKAIADHRRACRGGPAAQAEEIYRNALEAIGCHQLGCAGDGS